MNFADCYQVLATRLGSSESASFRLLDSYDAEKSSRSLLIVVARSLSACQPDTGHCDDSRRGSRSQLRSNFRSNGYSIERPDWFEADRFYWREWSLLASRTASCGLVHAPSNEVWFRRRQG